MEKPFNYREILELHDIDIQDFGTCQRADGSYYGHGGQKCHQGTEATIPTKIARSSFMKKLSPANQKKVGAAVEATRQKISGIGYSSDGIQMWDKAIENQFNELSNRIEDGGYDESKAVSSAMRMWDPEKGRVANEMLGKAPTKLIMDGQLHEPSLNMIPEVRSAQVGWRDPITDSKYKTAQLDKQTGELVAEKHKSGVGDSNIILTGNGRDMLAYKAKLESEGKSWPPDNSGVAVDPKEVRRLSDENPTLWRSGFNTQDKGKERSEAFDVYDIENKNPSPEVLARRQAKNDAVVEGWLKYDRKSPLTGLDVPLPVGGNNVTVDHVKPLSSFAKAGRSKIEESTLANVGTNFHITERALNRTKGENTHADLYRDVTNILDGGFTKKMTDNWGNTGSKITISEAEFNRRFPNAPGQFSSAADRQRFASAYEQRRIAGFTGANEKTTVPTTSRKRNAPDPLRAFTPPEGTINTTAKAATAPTRSTRRSSPSPTPRTQTSTPKKEETKTTTTPKRNKAGNEKMELRRRINKARRDGRDADAAALEAVLATL